VGLGRKDRGYNQVVMLLFNNVGEKGFCLAHFINDGVQLSGNTATFEFTGVGDFETFQCDLDRKGFKLCKMIIYTI
jgi:hypothetical protein